MNNIIGNPQTKISKTTSMNDKDYLENILEKENAMVKNLSIALTEASNNDLYGDYYDMFNEIVEMQRQIYNLLFKNGWYSLEMAKEKKIYQKLHNLEKELSQLEIDG